jgi:predicted nucleotide-binding protein
VSTLQAGDDPPVENLAARITSTLASIFGQDSAEYRRLRGAASIDATSYTLSLYGDGGGTSVQEIRDGVDKGRNRSVSLLQGEVDALREDLQHAAPAAPELPKPQKAAIGKDVFIVHGRDSPAKVEVARLVERAGLNAVILHEQPNQGRTIIEKFEDHGGASDFAIIVLTPDDVGGPDSATLQPRARQNVIGEMFWFAGRLGRDRVCALKKGNIEMPSDFAGVGYTEMDDRGAWKQELLKELQAAGYMVDWGKALA